MRLQLLRKVSARSFENVVNNGVKANRRLEWRLSRT
jgi:hypothetical protein